jgi:monofunctional biosynthetic peptidoglycan transglycosylase
MRRAALALGVLAGSFLLWLIAIWPPPVWYRTHWPARTAFMGIRPPTPFHYRPVPIDSIAPVMVDAVIIGEDGNFLTHHGIDYLALAQALGYPRRTFTWKNPTQRRELLAVLPRAWNRRDRLRGASTITQQLAKNLYLSPSRNPLRKLKEAVTAWRLEAAVGKQRIMELYLNVVELGPGVWGVEAASQAYFRQSARELSAEQAAALAGTLPFPLRSNPGFRPGRMLWRRDLILRRMRGEDIEVPPVEEEPDAQVLEADSTLAPPDSILWPDDSLDIGPDSAVHQPSLDSAPATEAPESLPGEPDTAEVTDTAP